MGGQFISLRCQFKGTTPRPAVASLRRSEVPSGNTQRDVVSEYGAERVRRDHLGMRVTNPRRDARDARARVAAIRAEADEFRGVPVSEAARRIMAGQAKQEDQR